MSQRFLIVRLSALGDTVCSLPAAVAIKCAFPGAEISWVVDQRFKGAVECCRSVDKIIAVPKKKLKEHLKDVGTEPYEAVLDLQGLLKSALFAHAASSELKLGYHWMREGAWLFTQRVLPDPTSVHVVDQYVDVARAAGGKADRAFFDLHPHFDDLEMVQQKLRSRGIGERFIVLNAGAGWASKRWPARSFAKLADMLALAHLQTVFLGSLADKAVFEEIQSHGAKDAASMIGETNVRELIALISLATLHVGGDTGSTHISAALGKPSIGLYSLTRPERTGPYGQIGNCVYDSRSLASIEVETVFGMILGALT